jgi:excisionase family DNA binding protein
MHDKADYVRQPLLSPQELADRLGVSRATVYRNSAVWPSLRVGSAVRFDYDAVVAYLERQRVAS